MIPNPFISYPKKVLTASRDQPAKFSCPNGRTFFSSSIVWGVIGPTRMFGSGSIYQYFNVFWVIGALLPCILYAFVRFGGRLAWVGRSLHAPIMLGAMGWLPPATPLSFSTWGIVALLFNHVLRRRYHGWWSTYNYITAAALDAGLVLSTIVIFFAITLPGVTIPQWWGNVGVYETMVSCNSSFFPSVPCWQWIVFFATFRCATADSPGQKDSEYTAILKKVGEGETFGPSTW